MGDSEQSDVDQPAGAFLMIRRAAWELIGGFDERFHPVWFEDVDFCKRLHREGLRIVYVPSAVALHAGGHSADKLAWGTRQLYWYGSLLRYAAKHFTGLSRRAVSLAVALACVPRAISGVMVQRTLTPVSVFSKVFWLAGSSLLARQTGAPDAPARDRTDPDLASQVVEKHVQQ
jgi:GT2 family glycosyltransferase